MKGSRKSQHCAYCGISPADTVDHVIPRSLYPRSRPSSRDRRITVPSCLKCNNGCADDEVQFRNVVCLAGNATAEVHALWKEKIRPSFDKLDKIRRLRDLVAQIMPVETAEGQRHSIYPAENDRVLRIARKITRGLCHHHGLLSPVHDKQVWADIQRFAIPPDILRDMHWGHAESQIFQYHFCLTDDPDVNSCWLLTFYTRTPFICIVFQSAEARARFETRFPSVSEWLQALPMLCRE
jgi:hypothetical protein